MNPRTLARLDKLAAEREARLHEAIRRHGAALAQSQAQRQMLSAYRIRLAESWQDGTPVPASQARSASQFATGAENAALQIEQGEAAASAQLQEAATALAQVKAHRRKLAEQLRAEARAEVARAEVRAERDRPWRNPRGSA